MSQFVIGQGTQITVAPLTVGSIVEPGTGSLISQATLVAKAATSIPLTGTAGVVIPAGTYLGFTDPVSGKVVTVKLTATTTTSSSALTVAATPAAIAASSTCAYPLKLANRTDVKLDRQGKVTSQFTFDDLLWESSATTGLSAKVDVPGSWSQLDPSYLTVESQWLQGLPIYVWVTFKTPSSDYSAGTIFKGVAIIVNLPIDAKADGIISGDISLQFSGAITKVDPTPT
jgi:hypothetical protein